MTSYHIIVFLIKTRLFIFMDQVDSNDFTDFAVYQWFEKKLIYLTFGTGLISFL